MEEDLLPIQPAFKIYNDRAIYAGTFLGGPLVGGYLIAENFRQFGQTDKVVITRAIAIFATIVIFAAAFFIPDIKRVPHYLIPLIYTGITQFLVQKFQGENIKKHIAAGGQTFTTWRAVWIGLAGLFILLAVVFGIALATNNDVF